MTSRFQLPTRSLIKRRKQAGYLAWRCRTAKLFRPARYETFPIGNARCCCKSHIRQLLTVDDRPVQACLRYLREKDWGEKDYPCLSDLSLLLSFCTRASVFAANGVSRIDPFYGERAFLIKLEHPPLRNYEVSLIVPAPVPSRLGRYLRLSFLALALPACHYAARSAITTRRWITNLSGGANIHDSSRKRSRYKRIVKEIFEFDFFEAIFWWTTYVYYYL